MTDLNTWNSIFNNGWINGLEIVGLLLPMLIVFLRQETVAKPSKIILCFLGLSAVFSLGQLTLVNYGFSNIVLFNSYCFVEALFIWWYLVTVLPKNRFLKLTLIPIIALGVVEWWVYNPVYGIFYITCLYGLIFYWFLLSHLYGFLKKLDRINILQERTFWFSYIFLFYLTFCIGVYVFSAVPTLPNKAQIAYSIVFRFGMLIYIALFIASFLITRKK